MTAQNKPLPNEADPVWVGADEVLRQATKKVGSAKLAKRYLDRELHSGQICASCTTLIQEVDFTEVRSTPPSPGDQFVLNYRNDLGHRMLLGAAFWNSKVRSMFEDDLFQWKRRIFAFIEVRTAELRIEDRSAGKYWIRPPVRHVAYGVSFEKSDVDALLSKLPRDVVRRDLRKKTDANLRKRLTEWDWDAVLSEFKSLANERKLEGKYGPFDKRGVQAAIEVAIETKCLALFDTAPAVSTVRRKVKALMKLDRRPVASE